jgi:hypothetical protein
MDQGFFYEEGDLREISSELVWRLMFVQMSDFRAILE